MRNYSPNLVTASLTWYGAIVFALFLASRAILQSPGGIEHRIIGWDAK